MKIVNWQIDCMLSDWTRMILTLPLLQNLNEPYLKCWMMFHKNRV